MRKLSFLIFLAILKFSNGYWCPILTSWESFSVFSVTNCGECEDAKCKLNRSYESDVDCLWNNHTNTCVPGKGDSSLIFQISSIATQISKLTAGMVCQLSVATGVGRKRDCVKESVTG